MWVLKPGDLFGGRYRIQREIGAGGMAHVYAALDEELHETVALKIIKPELVGEEELVERFRREVRIARQIQHPNVIRIFEFGRTIQEEKVFYYITMELLPGLDLATWLGKRGPISLNEILEIALQLCDGLDEAHRNGVVHRDIKPQNIFIDENGRATIMDFGISRLTTLTGLTSGSQLMGTPRYMSPEQASGKQELDHRCDIYALGVVLYELCTQRAPFTGQTPVEIALRHLQDVPKPPRTINALIPTSLEKVILTCLQKDPDSRYESADGLRSALLTVAQDAGVENLFAEAIVPGGTVAQNGDSSAALHAEPSSDVHVEDTRAEPAYSPATTREKSVRGNRRLGLLIGGLLLIGAVAVLVSILVLRSQSPEAVSVQGQLDSGAEEAAAPPGENGSSLDSPGPSGTDPAPVSPARDEGAPPSGVTATGSVRISANPGTEIYVDGELVGTIPPVVMTQLSAGRHAIRYVIPEYDEFEQTVDVSGERQNVFFHHFPPFGVLRILCQPKAKVRLDGRELGETPIRAERIREGRHRLVLYRDGYKTIEQTIEIELGRINPFQFTLARR
jgi:serine/threonine-protein kinase